MARYQLERIRKFNISKISKCKNTGQYFKYILAVTDVDIGRIQHERYFLSFSKRGHFVALKVDWENSSSFQITIFFFQNRHQSWPLVLQKNCFYCFHENSLKMKEHAFYFIILFHVILKISTFLSFFVM